MKNKRSDECGGDGVKDARPLVVRMMILGVLVVGVLSLYVLSLGPVLAVAGWLWDRVWPSWFSGVVEVVYGPVLWCESHVPAAHAWIDWYVNWWVGFLDL